MLMLCLVLGFICEPHNNPADFFLDVINGDYSALSQEKLEDYTGLYCIPTHMYELFEKNDLCSGFSTLCVCV